MRGSKNTIPQLSNYPTIQLSNWRWKRQGFSLIEVLLAIFLIVALTTILFSASGTLFTTRRSKLQSQAAKFASREIEYLRNIPFADLPDHAANPNCLDPNVTTDLPTKLKAATCKDQFTNYDGILDEALTQIKLVTVTIQWTGDRGESQILNMDTLIYKNGL